MKPFARVESRIGSHYLFVCAGEEKPSLGNTDPTKLFRFDPFNKDEAEKVTRALNKAYRARVREELKAFVRQLVHEAEQNGDRPGPKAIDPYDVENIDIDAFLDREGKDAKVN